MLLMIWAILLIVAGAALALVLKDEYAVWPATAGLAGGCLLALIAAGMCLLGTPPANYPTAWQLFSSRLVFGLDALSALFVLPLGFIGLLVSCYAPAYLKHAPQRTQFVCLNLLVASMLAVLTVRDGLFFLLFWEIMSLTPLFLIYKHKTSGRQASWIYMIAAHAGALCLIVFFLSLGLAAGSTDFAAFSKLSFSSFKASGLFMLALVGFGIKAGLIPLHVWLPEAHPAAPSHVSALMSAVMIKLGVYGLIRALCFIGPIQLWWGGLILGLGLTSALLGALNASLQTDLKRLLAYCSIENVGVILSGLGLGLIGICLKSPAMTALGLAGALIHVINHALLKAGLFMGAGSVQHATGTLNLNQLGGLAHSMPTTSLSFLISAVGICALPPLNGFVGEFLILLAACAGLKQASLAALPTLAILPLAGGLAGISFAKAAGLGFLGQPRSPRAASASEAPLAMRLPQIVLALTCLALGLLAGLTPKLLLPALTSLTSEAEALMQAVTGPLLLIGSLGGASLIAGAALHFWRNRRLKRQGCSQAPTWGCGYCEPGPQYTASSFGEPNVFEHLAWRERHLESEGGLFVTSLKLKTRHPDSFTRLFYGPALRLSTALLARLRPLQAGGLHFYIFYLLLSLIVTLIILLAGLN